MAVYVMVPLDYLCPILGGYPMAPLPERDVFLSFPLANRIDVMTAKALAWAHEVFTRCACGTHRDFFLFPLQANSSFSAVCGTGWTLWAASVLQVPHRRRLSRHWNQSIESCHSCHSPKR